MNRLRTGFIDSESSTDEGQRFRYIIDQCPETVFWIPGYDENGKTIDTVTAWAKWVFDRIPIVSELAEVSKKEALRILQIGFERSACTSAGNKTLIRVFFMNDTKNDSFADIIRGQLSAIGFREENDRSGTPYYQRDNDEKVDIGFSAAPIQDGDLAFLALSVENKYDCVVRTLNSAIFQEIIANLSKELSQAVARS